MRATLPVRPQPRVTGTGTEPGATVFTVAVHQSQENAEQFDLIIIGSGSGNSIPDVPRRLEDRDRRAGHVRRHLPERRLHPVEDVRAARPTRRSMHGTATSSGSTPSSTAPTGRRSGTGSSAGSTRSPTAAASTGRPERRTSRSSKGPPGSSATRCSTSRAGSITAPNVLVAAGSRPVDPTDPRARRDRVPHVRLDHAARRPARTGSASSAAASSPSRWVTCSRASARSVHDVQPLSRAAAVARRRDRRAVHRGVRRAGRPAARSRADQGRASRTA